MKRSILFLVGILVLLSPLMANTENEPIADTIESPSLPNTEPTKTVVEPVIGPENATPIIIAEPVALESTEPVASKEILVIPSGNTTISGVNGYLVIPSAEPAPGGKGISITTGYSGIFSSGVYAHVPFVQLGFSEVAETSLALEIATKTDILLNAKWRFAHRNETSLAIGVVGQVIDVATEKKFGAQLYFASTFASSIMDFPSKTTILLGYTFYGAELKSNIDFGIAFQTPLLPKAFKNRVYFLLDFGNVSYSADPASGNANDRGLVNVGMRLVPIKVLKSVYLSADVRALDLFDHSGRALSLGLTLTYRPQYTPLGASYYSEAAHTHVEAASLS